jgi:hypothetical protein
MKTFADLTTPRTQLAILAARIQGLQGISPVTQTGPEGAGSGTGVGNVVASGVAQVDAAVVIRIATSGEPNDGLAQYELSLDGGVSFGVATAITTAPVVLTPTGARIAFVAAPTDVGESFSAGDLYAFDVATPVWDASAWQTFTVPRRIIDLENQASVQGDQLVALLAKGGYLYSSEGPWLDLVAWNVYQELRKKAGFAQGWLLLTDTAGVGPLTFQPGQLWASDAGGQLRFSNLGSATLPLNGTVKLLFSAENPGLGWNVGIGGVSRLITDLPGVTVTNPNYVSAVTVSRVGAIAITVAAGTGTISPVTGDYSVRLEITTSGVRGTSRFRYSIDGGKTWAATGVATPTGGSYSLGATGIVLVFAAGSYGLGDIYTLEATVTWLTQAGNDRELDGSLQARCSSKWATLSQSDAPPGQAYEKWATDASDLVTRALAQADDAVPGQVDLFVAGASGDVAAEVVTAVDDYVQVRVGLGGTVVTASAVAETVAVAGVIYVRAGFKASAQAAGLAALAAYGAGLPIGGNQLSAGKGVSREEIIAALMSGTRDHPVIGTTDATITAPAGDTVLTIPQVPVFDTSGLSWVEI